MVEPRPTKIPRWNDTGGNRAEPPESTPSPPGTGSKDNGWSVNDKPPSSYFNWLQYYNGSWFKWLAERILKGSLEHDLTINALTPDAPGAGGRLILRAGDGNDPGAGGYVDIRGGDGVNGAGGLARLYGGDGDGAAGGGLFLRGGSSNTANGGDVEVIGGSSMVSGNGGNLTLSGGVPTDGNGGDVTVFGRNAVGTGDGGDVYVYSGNGSTNGRGGDINVNSGNGVGQRGGNFAATAGDSDTDPGDVSISAGAGTSTANGGTAALSGGNAANGIGGDLTLKGGDSSGTNKDPGDVIVETGDATGSQGGQIKVRVAEAGVAGSGTNSPTPYVDHDGRDILKQTTHYRYTQFQDGGTKDGERGVIRLVPQSARPSAPLTGDVWPNSTMEQLAYYNGTRYHNLNPYVYDLNQGDQYAQSNAGAGASSNCAFQEYPYPSGPLSANAVYYRIPANSLRVGNIIVVKAQANKAVSASNHPYFTLFMGDIGAGPPFDAPTGLIVQGIVSSDWLSVAAEFNISVASLGASGAMHYTGNYNYDTAVDHRIIGGRVTRDTTGDLDIFPVLDLNGTTYTANLWHFTVQIH